MTHDKDAPFLEHDWRLEGGKRYYYCECGCPSLTIEMLFEGVKNIEGVSLNASGWISVDDRLPELDGVQASRQIPVLVEGIAGWRKTTYYDVPGIGKGWNTFGAVTHWYDLPPDPREANDG